MSDRAKNGQFTRDNRFRLRPDGEPPPPDPDPARERLKTALAAVKEEEERLAALEQALERCTEEGRAARRAARDSAALLAEMRRTSPGDLAYAYANNSEVLERSHAVDVQRAAVARDQREIERLDEIESALSSEIRDAEMRLRLRRGAVRDATSQLICSSRQFHSLLDEIDRTQARLRGLRKAAAVISKEIGGLPRDAHGRVWQVWSLDPDTLEPVDPEPAAAWSRALAELAHDADALLPNGADK